MTQSRVADLTGQVIANCRIERKLGEGGFGAVFLGAHEGLRNKAAIKLLPTDPPPPPQFVRRFFREARALAQLQHPHIVPVHDVGETDAYYFIVMKYIEAPSLEQIVREKGRFSISRALRLIRDLADAMAYAHDRGILHRDLKPENVLYDETTARATIIDFGLARMEDAGTEGSEVAPLTVPGQIIGTPMYMAPEQAEGKASDARTDIYSLGAVGFFALTADFPFTGKTGMEVLIKKTREKPRKILDLRPEIPLPVANMIQKMMARDPDHRFQQMARVRDILNQALAPRDEEPPDEWDATSASGPVTSDPIDQIRAQNTRVAGQSILDTLTGPAGSGGKAGAAPMQQAQDSTPSPFGAGGGDEAAPPPPAPAAAASVPADVDEWSESSQPPKKKQKAESKPGATRGMVPAADKVVPAREEAASGKRARETGFAPPVTVTDAPPVIVETGELAPETGGQPADLPTGMLRRKATVRYHERMNPARNFPLLVVLSADSIAKQIQRDVVQVEGQSVGISRKRPVVRVVPQFPGCICVPESIEVDVTPEQTELEFWVTPHAEGKLNRARVEIWHDGRRLDSVACPTVVRKQTWARVCAAAAIASPVFIPAFESSTGSTLQDVTVDGVQVGLPALAAAVGGYSILGLIGGGVCLLGAAVMWWLTRPKQADPVDAFLKVSPARGE